MIAEPFGNHVVRDHVGDVGDLELGEETGHSADRRVGQFKRVELHLFDQRAEIAELGGGIDLDLDAPLAARFQKRLQEFSGNVVVGYFGRRADMSVFQGELLLRARRRRQRQ